jgi:serine protease inhibitor
MSLKSEIEFCTNVLKFLDSSSEESVIFAPSLILCGFSMIYAGSDGITAKEFENIIGKGKTREEILQYYSNFIQYCKDVNQENAEIAKDVRNWCYKVLFSNKLFLSAEPSLTSEFENIMAKKFDNDFEQVNFTNPEETAEKINNFVKEKTEEHIKELVEVSDIDKKMNIFIVSALCFKAHWAEAFEETMMKEFYSKNGVREIEMMSHEAN